MLTLTVIDRELAPALDPSSRPEIIGHVMFSPAKSCEHPEHVAMAEAGYPWHAIARWAIMPLPARFRTAEDAIYALQAATVAWPDYPAIERERDWRPRITSSSSGASSPELTSQT